MEICKKKLDFYLQNSMQSGKQNLKLPLFIKIQDSCFHIKDHIHDFTELVIVLDGSGTLVCNEFRCCIKKCDVFVIPREASHRYENFQDLKIANIMFDYEKLPLPKIDLPLLPGYHLLIGINNEYFAAQQTFPIFQLGESLLTSLLPLLNMMQGECLHQRPGVNFRMMGLFMTLLGNLAVVYSEPVNNSRHDASNQLGNLVAFMNREFHRVINYSELLKLVPMSRSTFNRAFIRATGVPPMRYLLNLRLNHAAKLLATTDMPIMEVAIACGFEDSNYFSRAFNKNFHISPRAYRNMPIPVLDC